MDIGQKLKRRRKILGLTQEEVAMRAELTKGFISQVERGKTSPSVDSLGDILEALGMDFGEFFKEEENAPIIYTPEDFYRYRDEERNSVLEFVVSDAQGKRMEPCIFTLSKGGETKVEPEFEGEDFCYILEGSVVLFFGKKAYDLNKGSCFYTDGSKSRQIKAGKDGAKFLWITTPPNF
ncbi:MAG: helix-turn-helix domain-containing protein [Tissierellia bacterium]|nr:helix-turn-helix domain-containing protein [Tissierellia bacterium]